MNAERKAATYTRVIARLQAEADPDLARIEQEKRLRQAVLNAKQPKTTKPKRVAPRSGF